MGKSLFPTVNVAAYSTIWTFNTSDSVLTSPAIGNDGMVYIGSDDGYLYALEGDTGALRYKYDVGGSIRSSCPLIDGNGYLYIGSDDDSLLSIDMATFSSRWKFKASGNIRSSPVLFNGVLYFGTEGGVVYAVDTDSGSVVWTYFVAYPIVSSPVISTDGDYLFVIISSNRMLIMLRATGELTASVTPAGSTQASPLSSVVFLDGTIIYGTGYGALVKLDWEKKQVTSIFSSVGSAAIRTAPIYDSDGILYFGTDDSYFYAIDGFTGNKKWSFKSVGPIRSDAALSRNGVLFFGTYSGMFYAINSSTGELRIQ
jgi:outer membrane protein assembly factor BamB